jgi:hypothetical protein
MSKFLVAGLVVVSGAIVLVSAGGAEAAIRCKDGYQIVQGNYLATPYCQDDLLARVAREYGMRASAAAIRGNPNYKKEVCRLVGRDIRVQNHCLDAFPGRGRR